MKYKNISTEGTYNIRLGGRIQTKPGSIVNVKIKDEFVSVLPGEIIDSPIVLYDSNMMLIDESEEEPEEELPDVDKQDDDGKYSYTDLKDMNKAEQVKILESFGFSKKEIKDLCNEEGRIQAILTKQDEKE